MIKPILPAAALIGASLLLPTATSANDYSGIDHYCYMVNGAGEVMDLNHFCIRSNPESTEVASVEAAIPMAGLVCDDFATQGESQYHFLSGTAPKSLDGDNDGVACEVLTDEPREDGNRIFSNQSTRGDGVIDTEVWRVSATDYYLNVGTGGYSFTTRSFPSGDAARDHIDIYYGDLVQ
ncbi:MAG: excalibur calcium-binding domain-containing protein [Tildeniella torsiva UHER 1998/13D]|jgi:hypothetical protein|nr:excalibur calcium-binding domain-containing protein [Tildeniella torsiva UHER 1998/13D]